MNTNEKTVSKAAMRAAEALNAEYIVSADVEAVGEVSDHSIAKVIDKETGLPDLLSALQECDKAFVSWQLGQIPGRPEDILALITKVRSAIARATGETI